MGARLAVRAADGHLFTRIDDPAAWTDLGGRLISTPTPVDVPQTNNDYYVGLGTDHQLWVRTDVLPWRHLVATSVTYSCHVAPELRILQSMMAVACTGRSAARSSG